jgi:protein associated with RNAse G/E
MQITVRLFKPLKDKIVTYEAALIEQNATELVLHARWWYKRIEAEYVVFEPGDHLYEYFYTDRWYNVYRLCTEQKELKGWYCNITRPARFDGHVLESEDLELDVFVSPDRATILVMDEDEYAERGLEHSDPFAHQQAYAALAEVQRLAREGAYPFVDELPAGGYYQ